MIYLAIVLQIAVIAFSAPLLVGILVWIKSRAEGRRSPNILQPWREIRKLFYKQVLDPSDVGIMFRIAPLVLFASTATTVIMVPLLTTELPLHTSFDLFWLVGFFLLGTIALALGSLDGATVFGGIGASRELMVVALLEPSMLMAVFALSIRANSTNLFAIANMTLAHPALISSPASVLSFASLSIVLLAESGRLPIDNPTTHLELTMIHEAMTLEYSGYRLALVKWASAMRLVLLLGLIANLFVPIGIAVTDNLGSLALGIIALALKISLLIAVLGIGEVFLAKIRLFRVPELLGGSFVLGLLAVTASYYFPGIAR